MEMTKRIIIGVAIAGLLTGLIFVAHTIDFVGILLDIHGG